MSLGQFYTRKEDSKQFKMYKKILNGIILTEFDKKTGVSYSNDSYQIFVTKDELENSFTNFDFKLETTESMNRIVSKALKEILYQLQNHGIEENKSRSFDEFMGHSPVSCSVLSDMVKNPKCEFKDFFSNSDDEWEMGEAEDIFYFLKDGVTPILKKMLLEAQNEI
jgi:hypothetical protein